MRTARHLLFALCVSVAVSCGDDPFTRVEVVLADLEGESVELELILADARHRTWASGATERFEPVLERGTPFHLRIVTQPEATDRRCFAPLRELRVGERPRVRCRVERVCDGLEDVSLPSEVRFEDAFPSLEWPERMEEGAPRSYADVDRAGGHLYLASGFGEVFRFEDDAATTTMTEVLDIEDRVHFDPGEGLFALALHPRFPSVPHLFVQYLEDGAGAVHLSRFTSMDEGASFDPDSEVDILTLPKPDGRDHNGGLLRFGPDGMLWTSFGDGGFTIPPLTNAQELDNLHGTIIRIDVDGELPYEVPPDNPFLDVPDARPEIWAYGLRNVFRGAFDRETGELFVGDVGGALFEELDRIDAGANYGWPIREGFVCQDGSESCPSEGFVEPIHTYEHTEVYHAIIGGPVYRGRALDGLSGSLLFADYQTGEIFALRDPYGTPELEVLGDSGAAVVAFLQDEDGEVLILGFGGGLLRMRPAEPGIDAPSRLSNTGCMDRQDPAVPRSGFVPYDIEAPLWSDGASKRRWVFLPDGERISWDGSGDAELPPGSALLKEFSRDGRRLETRVILHQADGRWLALSYRWNEDGSDATLVEDPIETTIDGRPWLFPDPGQCPTCHTDAAGFSLGMTARQVVPDNDRGYPVLARARVVPPEAPDLASLVDPMDDSAPVDVRARSFLHANCSGCHRPEHPIRARLDLRFGTELGATGLCDIPVVSDLGIRDARIVAPGEPDRSILWHRATSREPRVQMPPLATFELPAAAGVLEAWIVGLERCE